MHRAVRLGGHDASARLLIQAVHDAGTLFASDARQVVATMVQERIDERAVGIAGGRMHDQADGLIDHEEVVILEEDIKGDVLGDDFGRLGIGEMNRDAVARRNGSFGTGFLVIEEDVPVLEERLNARAGELREFPSEVEVEAFAGLLLDSDEHGLSLELSAREPES